MITDKTIERIKKSEGLRLKPYRCTAGKLTIGYGHNLDDNGITETEALLILEDDLEKCSTQLERYTWFRNLDEARQGVLIDMCFNMGITRLLQFKKMIKAIEESNWKEASVQMLDSVWAKQVKTRATNLAKIMKTGVE